ncbi:MAG TPA: hypothetical protein ENJ20_00780 [Bacteroidetes bacterium]|nr:hypothetical protein [Bacteroidota bacterium]
MGIGAVISAITKYRSIEKKVGKKLKKKFDNIITEKKGDILALIDQQSREKQFVKNKKILVLTAKNGDDVFLRKFFKTMGFPIDNVNYEKVEEYEAINGYDLIFANNENDDLNFELISSYFENSSPKTVLFYFGFNRFTSNNPKIKDRLSFANAKTQIYGNLINLFKYQDIL